MQQYKRVPKNKETEQIVPNEIRVTSAGRVRNYISYAVSLFEPTEQTQQAYDHVVLKAMRKAINKAVSVAEILKRRVKGLHQQTEIQSTTITDTFKPTEEGLKEVTDQRTVASVTITLSKKAINPNHPGYQVPLPESEVQPLQQPKPRQPREVEQGGEGEGEDAEQGEGRGRRRPRRGARRYGGRGRGGRRGGFRRGGRGGFSGEGDEGEGEVEHEQSTRPERPENSERPRGRGRGRGARRARGGERGERGERGSRGGRGGERGGRGGRSRGRGGFTSGDAEART